MFETQLDEICLFPLQNKKDSFTSDDKKADEVKNFGRAQSPAGLRKAAPDNPMMIAAALVKPDLLPCSLALQGVIDLKKYTNFTCSSARADRSCRVVFQNRITNSVQPSAQNKKMFSLLEKGKFFVAPCVAI